MKYTMKLDPKYFDYIKYGTKRVEVRLYDEKRKGFKIGDEILFQKWPDFKEEVSTEIVGFIVKRSFKELIESLDVCEYADKSEREEDVLKDFYKFFKKEQEEEYGVVGIQININSY